MVGERTLWRGPQALNERKRERERDLVTERRVKLNDSTKNRVFM